MIPRLPFHRLIQKLGSAKRFKPKRRTPLRLFQLEHRRTPATITVTDSADGLLTDTKVTLREALQSINNGVDFNADVSANRVGSYGVSDTIVFSSYFASPRTILLVSSSLLVSKSLTINGPSAELTISAQNASRVLAINILAAGGTVALSNLTLTAGHTGSSTISTNRGGGIRIEDEIVTLTNMKIQSNQSAAGGGGIYTASTSSKLSLVNSLITGNSSTRNGGGLYMNGGTLTVNNSAISNNKAYFQGGGGLCLLGTNATITTSSISGNHADASGASTASGYGGGILVRGTNNTLSVTGCAITGNTATGGGATSKFGGYGGGIATYYFTDGTISLTNCTVSGNSANKGLASSTGGHGGGLAIGYNPDVILNITACTFAYNNASVSGGNLFPYYSGATTTIDSSIFSNGTAPAGPDIFNNSVTPLVATYTLVGISSSSFIAANGTNRLDAPAMLDPTLQLNGGTTLNHALLGGSEAIDNGNDAVTGIPFNLITDQRNSSRKAGAHVDIGAFEIQPAAPPPTVQSINWQNNEIQRSMVTTVKVTFSEPVLLPPGAPESAFTLSRYTNGPSGTVALSVAQNGAEVTITFKNGGTINIDPGNSLQDGTYRLTIDASKVGGVGGNMTANAESNVHRLFGDGNGDGNVTSQDFAIFRTVFGVTGATFDYDKSGSVNSDDFAEFRKRFGLQNFTP